MTREERQKAMGALKISAPVMAMTQEEFNDYIKTINQIMDWLEQEPCEDAVSLDGVIDTIEWYRTNPQHFTEDNLIEDMKGLPPVTPKPRTGKWINNHTQCSICEWGMEDDVVGSAMMLFFLYCPNCGAKMEDKE